MTLPDRPPPSLRGAVLGGTVGAVAIMATNQLAESLGLTELDLPRVLGLTFRNPGQEGVKPTGHAYYAAWGGLVVPGLYWLGLRKLGSVGGRAGLALGVVHYLLSGAILAVTTPRRPKCRRGKGRPMGGFVSGYGPLEWTANLGGHLAYGALIGAGADRRAARSLIRSLTAGCGRSGRGRSGSGC